MYSEYHQLFQWTALYAASASTGQAYEIAVGSLRFAGPQAVERGGPETLAKLAPVLSNYWKNSFVGIPGNCYLSVLKLNQIDRNGHYVSDGDTIQLALNPAPVGVLSPIYPTQVAWATTWETAASRGRAKAGRTFWPTSQPVSSANSRVGDNPCLEKAKADWKLIQDLNTAINDGKQPGGAVASVMSNIGEGLTRPITGSRVGNRLDIQRRRANAGPEAYQQWPAAS